MILKDGGIVHVKIAKLADGMSVSPLNKATTIKESLALT